MMLVSPHADSKQNSSSTAWDSSMAPAASHRLTVTTSAMRVASNLGLIIGGSGGSAARCSILPPATGCRNQIPLRYRIEFAVLNAIGAMAWSIIRKVLSFA